MRIEFVGGPKDGERLEVSGLPWEYRIPGLHSDHYRKMWEPRSVPTDTCNVLVGTYRRRSEHNVIYDWQGWE